MNALLLAATSKHKSFYLSKSFGIQRVASEFRDRGVKTQVVHYFNYLSDDELVELVNTYCNKDTLLVGFSTVWWEKYDEEEKTYVMEQARKLANLVREKNSSIKIIAGGGSCKLFIEDQWKDIVDAIFEGMSEDDFIKYLEACKGNILMPIPNTVINGVDTYNNITTDFNFNKSSTKYVDEDYMVSTEVPSLEVARGCIFRCKFCSFQLNGKKKFDYIKEQRALKDEVMQNYESYGITNYLLSDDTFNDSTYKLQMIHEVFTELPFQLNFATFLRLDLLNAHPEQISLLKEMGMIGAYFGIESFHKKAASNIGKGLDGERAKELLAQLKDEYWGHRIKIAAGLIVGLPHETYDSYDKTVEWILDENNKVDQVVPFPLTVINLNNARPHPWESEFQLNADKYGFYWPDNHPFNWHNDIGPVKSFVEAKRV